MKILAVLFLGLAGTAYTISSSALATDSALTAPESEFEKAMQDLPAKVKTDKKVAPKQKDYTCKSPNGAKKTMTDQNEFQTCIDNKGTVTFGE
jgi:hypothetical protein